MANMMDDQDDVDYDILDDIDKIEQGIKKKKTKRKERINVDMDKLYPSQMKPDEEVKKYIDGLKDITEKYNEDKKKGFEMVGHKGDFSEYKRDDKDYKTDRWWNRRGKK